MANQMMITTVRVAEVMVPMVRLLVIMDHTRKPMQTDPMDVLNVKYVGAKITTQKIALHVSDVAGLII